MHVGLERIRGTAGRPLNSRSFGNLIALGKSILFFFACLLVTHPLYTRLSLLLPALAMGGASAWPPLLRSEIASAVGSERVAPVVEIGAEHVQKSAHNNLRKVHGVKRPEKCLHESKSC